MFQNSVWGVVMLNPVTYDQDCMSLNWAKAHSNNVRNVFQGQKNSFSDVPRFQMSRATQRVLKLDPETDTFSAKNSQTVGKNYPRELCFNIAVCNLIKKKTHTSRVASLAKTFQPRSHNKFG